MPIDKTMSQRASSAYNDTINYAQDKTLTGASATQSTNGVNSSPGGSPTGATGELSSSAIITFSPDAQLFARALSTLSGGSDVRLDRMAAARARHAQEPSTDDDDRLAATLLGSEH